MDCPEIKDLAAYAETQEASGALKEHLGRCDACQEALQTLAEEVSSLQIPLSEIWFREHISCLPAEVLTGFRAGELDAALTDYVKFHVEDLECAFCQARLGEAELQASRDSKRSVTKSRKRVGEATAVLLDSLRRAPE